MHSGKVLLKNWDWIPQEIKDKKKCMMEPKEHDLLLHVTEARIRNSVGAISS